MATFIVLINFTEKGINQVKQTTQRAAAFVDAAKKAGATVKGQYWTIGAYDGVLVLEAADDVKVTSVLLSLSSQGNVRTQTLRAFNASEMQAVLAESS